MLPAPVFYAYAVLAINVNSTAIAHYSSAIEEQHETEINATYELNFN